MWHLGQINGLMIATYRQTNKSIFSIKFNVQIISYSHYLHHQEVKHWDYIMTQVQNNYNLDYKITKLLLKQTAEKAKCQGYQTRHMLDAVVIVVTWAEYLPFSGVFIREKDKSTFKQTVNTVLNVCLKNVFGNAAATIRSSCFELHIKNLAPKMLHKCNSLVTIEQRAKNHPLFLAWNPTWIRISAPSIICSDLKPLLSFCLSNLAGKVLLLLPFPQNIDPQITNQTQIQPSKIGIIRNYYKCAPGLIFDSMFYDTSLSSLSLIRVNLL